jgi:hypothetical protein
MNYRLRSMPSAQAHVEFVYNKCEPLVAIRLYSYRSCILETVRMEKGGIYHWVTNVVFNPAYSRTTTRHVNRFTHELFGCNYYFECKEAWANESPLAEVLNTNVIMDFWNGYQQYGKHFHY